MNSLLKTLTSFIAIILLSVFISCQEDPQLPDNLIQFESTELGTPADESETNIRIALSREITSASSVDIQMESTGLTYGVDFVTEPEAVGNVLSLPIASRSSESFFLVKKLNGVLLDGDESIVFTISTAPEFLVLGEKNQLTLNFAEIISASGSMDINGGGPTYPNKVFIDLSANRQVAIPRTSWDFAFSSGADYRVVLNSANGMMARVLTKNDMNAVTAADTVGFGAQLSMAAVFGGITSDPAPAWVLQAVNWIDDPAGDLTKTTIPQIAAGAADNKVVIVNLGDGPGAPAPNLGWRKIRVLRNGDGYTIQHAAIDATTFSEIQVTKNTSHAFQYVSLTGGVVQVAPPTGRWDIAWSGFTNATNFGTGPVPYYFQDMILQNTTGVSTLQILTSTKTYESFTESDVASLDFGPQSQVKIGSSWRSGGGPGVAPSIRSDRFYVIKDADDNYYKLRFTALTTSGERGKPKFEYALVKKGN